MKTFKTLEEICRAYPLKVPYIIVVYDYRSDYEHNLGRIDLKTYVMEPLEVALKSWQQPLEYVHTEEVEHTYWNYDAMQKDADALYETINDEVKRLQPDLADRLYGAIEAEKDEKYRRVEIEHQSCRIEQVCIPGYHAEYMGRSIDVNTEILWANPIYKKENNE